jgi:hypothetical protein
VIDKNIQNSRNFIELKNSDKLREKLQTDSDKVQNNYSRKEFYMYKKILQLQNTSKFESKDLFSTHKKNS